ncbi:MAG: ABC transporter substrate-binding protein [Acidimicrobiales bacterium]
MALIPRRHGLRALVAGAAAVLVAAVPACSGPAPGGPGSSGSLVVGIEVATTGPAAAVGRDVLRGAQLAASRIDAAGGVLGRRLTVVAADDNGTVLAVHRAVDKLLAASPIAVIGSIYPALAAAADPLLRAAGIPEVRVSEGGAPGGGVSVAWTDDQLVVTEASEVVNVLHASSAAAVVDPAAAQIVPALLKLLDHAGVSTPAVTLGTSGDPAPLLDALEAGRPDVLLLAADDQTAAKLLDVAPPPSGSRCLVVGSPIGAPVSAAGGCLAVGLPPPPDLPGGAAYVSAYLHAYGSATSPGALGALAYDAVSLVADAAGRAGSAGHGKLEAALGATVGFAGVTGSITAASGTGDRVVPPLVVLDTTDAGVTGVDPAWAAFAGWTPPRGK